MTTSIAWFTRRANASNAGRHRYKSAAADGRGRRPLAPVALGDQFLGLVEARALFVQPDLSAPTCRDPEDSALLATAVGGQATCLVSADPDILDDPDLHLALAARGVHVMRAPELLDILEAGHDAA